MTDKFADEGRQRRRIADDLNHAKICAFVFQGEKCQRLGTMSSDTRGGGPWFCPDHFFGRRPKPEVARQNWREEVIEQRIQPGDYRQAGETRSEYRKRMMAEIRNKVAVIGALPYDKNERDEERAAIQELS